MNVSFGKQLKKPQVSANAISANFLEIPGKFRAAESETRPIKTNLNKFLVPSVKNALLRIDQANDNLRMTKVNARLISAIESSHW